MLNLYKYNYFFFSRFFYKFINKFSLKGNNNRIEFFFEQYLLNLKKRKKNNFFFFFLEALNILKPEIGVKIFKFSKNKNVKRKKKGTKLAIRTKVIPVIIHKKAKYNLALKWIISRIKISPRPNFQGITKEIINVLSYKRQSAIGDKKKLRRVVLSNRGAIHYRW